MRTEKKLKTVSGDNSIYKIIFDHLNNGRIPEMSSLPTILEIGNLDTQARKLTRRINPFGRWSEGAVLLTSAKDGYYLFVPPQENGARYVNVTLGGVVLGRRGKIQSEIGLLHSHQMSLLPTSVDLMPLFSRRLLLCGTVTDLDGGLFIRTRSTCEFAENDSGFRQIAQHLWKAAETNQIAVTRIRRINQVDYPWYVCTGEVLKNLGIAFYQTTWFVKGKAVLA